MAGSGGSQGYLGELYIQDSDSIINNSFIRIGVITEFSLKIMVQVKDISTHSSLAKNKSYRNFESNFKSWNVSLKKILIDNELSDLMLSDAIDNGTKFWLKIVPKKLFGANNLRTVFVGRALLVSQSIKNSLTSVVDNALQLIGSGPLFKLKEDVNRKLQFETGCVETAMANGCDLAQIGTSIAQVDIASIIQPPIQAPNLSLPISSFVNIGTQYSASAPVGWSPLLNPATVGAGESNYSFWDKSFCGFLWSFAGYDYPPIFPAGPAPLSAIVPGSYYYASVSPGTLKFEPISIQKSYLVPIPVAKYCLIDSSLAIWRYNAWMMLITEFTTNGAPTLGKRYSIDFKIIFYGADRITVVGEFNMPNYAIHNAEAWYDPNMSGVVPFGARYWRTFLTWNNPDFIASDNYYGVYGFFLDYRTYNLGLRFNF